MVAIVVGPFQLPLHRKGENFLFFHINIRGLCINLVGMSHGETYGGGQYKNSVGVFQNPCESWFYHIGYVLE